MNDAPRVEIVSWNVRGEELKSIRQAVFIDEQGVPPEIERDTHDATATHFLMTHGDRAIGCGRLLPDGKIGRMAVLSDCRGRGFGRQLLNFMVAYSRGKGVKRVYLHAQTHAADFYSQCGFRSCGDEFEEAGIPHQAMEQVIDYRNADGFITGVDYPEPFATLAVALAARARRHLRIYSQALDHEVFDNPALGAALTRLVRRGRQSDIRILVNDVRPMTMRGHRLLDLSRRLSSTIIIQVLDAHPALPDATYLVRDNDGILYKPDEFGANGFYEPASRASAKKFVDGFDRLWRWGRTDPRLRRLTM